MTNANVTKAHAIIKKVVAGEMTEEAAVDVLARTIGRAYYRGRDSAKSGKRDH